MALSTKTLDALNDSRKTEPHKYIWGQFTPDKDGVGYSDLPEQTDIPDDAKLVLDVNGPSLVTASITSIRGGLSGRIATTEKAGIVKPDGTTISVSSDGTISSSAGLPVGTVFISDLKYPEVPSGALEYNGTEIPGADELYPDFWNRFLLAGKMNTGSYTDYETAMTTNGGTCPFFALDVENKRFKTPTWADGVFAAAATTSGEINKYYNAGLPNITGSIDPYVDMNRNWSGAFSVNKTAPTNPSGTSGNGSGSHVMFDASKSNDIYGASDTVTPKHVRKRWFVQVANAIETTAYHNIDGTLATKVNKSGDTMTGQLQMSGENLIRFGTDDNYYFIKKINDGTFTIYNKNGKGLFLQKGEAYAPYYWDGTHAFRLLTTADLEGSIPGTISQFTHGTHTNGQPYFIIKFTNGLIIQGIKAVGNATTNWPTPFSTKVLSVLFGDTPLVDNEGSAITGWTLTNVSNSQKYGRRSPFIVGIGI